MAEEYFVGFDPELRAEGVRGFLRNTDGPENLSRKMPIDVVTSVPCFLYLPVSLPKALLTHMDL